MNLILLLMRTSWRLTALSAVIGGVSGIAAVAVMATILRTLEDPNESTTTAVLWFGLLCLIAVGTQFASRTLVVRLTQMSMLHLQMGLCRQLLGSSIRHVEEIGTPRILAALTGDVFIIAQAMNAVPTVMVSMVTLVCGAAYLGWLSPALLLATLVFAALGVASYLVSARWASGYLTRAREEQDELQLRIQQLIEGIKELRLHDPRQQDFVNQALLPAQTAARHSQFVGDSLQDLATTWGRLVFFAAIGLLLFAWPKLQPVDAVTLSGYVLTILYLMSPLDQIIGWMPYLKRAAVAVEKIKQLGLMLDDTQPEEIVLRTEFEQIELCGVTHAYPADGRQEGFVLGPADLTLTPGEIVFLTGGNGSGKTSLAKLITGLYEPEHGRILLDGSPVTEESRAGYRQLFSVVFDDAMVFDRLWGLHAEDLDQRAAEYIRELELDHIVSVTEGRFSTTDLSRGQRKRLALLTAYLEDRPVCVFDEWAADQDPEFRRLFYLKLLPELKARGKTIVAITHDDRYFGGADRIVKVEEGKLQERTPDPDTHEAQLELL